MRYAPDKDNPFPRPKPKPTGNNNGGGGQGGGMGGFMPGQIKGIANDLQMGYGGSDEKWNNYLRDVYSPAKLPSFNFGNGNRGNGGGHNNGGGNNPGTGPKPGDGGFDPSSPRNRMMPVAMQQPMQMQIPQMGLLNAPMPQPQQQQGLLGNIDPAVLAYITRR